MKSIHHKYRWIRNTYGMYLCCRYVVWFCMCFVLILYVVFLCISICICPDRTYPTLGVTKGRGGRRGFWYIRILKETCPQGVTKSIQHKPRSLKKYTKSIHHKYKWIRKTNHHNMHSLQKGNENAGLQYKLIFWFYIEM